MQLIFSYHPALKQLKMCRLLQLYLMYKTSGVKNSVATGNNGIENLKKP